MAEKECYCCKEPIGTIPILRIIDKLDSLFAKNDVSKDALKKDCCVVERYSIKL